MDKRKEKLCSLREAVALIPDGARVGLGGFSTNQQPMAVVYEMLRAGKKDLTLVGVVNSIESDILIGAGAVRRIETSYVGLENFGLARNFRRWAEAGRLEMAFYSEMLAWDRFRANREGMEFWPVNFLGGSDIAKNTPDIVPFKSPISGRQLWAVPAANLDVAVIHAYGADKYGNVQIQDRYLMPQSLAIDMSRGCNTTIVTVEKLLTKEEVMANSQRTIIPAFHTSCVVHVPNGSHPTATLGVTQTDEAFFNEYVAASESDEKFHKFLDKYIYGTSSFEEYLQLVNELHGNV